MWEFILKKTWFNLGESWNTEKILIKRLEGLRKLIQHFGSLYINSWIPNFGEFGAHFFWKPGLYCVNFDIFHANKSLYVQEYNGWIKIFEETLILHSWIYLDNHPKVAFNGGNYSIVSDRLRLYMKTYQKFGPAFLLIAKLSWF